MLPCKFKPVDGRSEHDSEEGRSLNLIKNGVLIKIEEARDNNEFHKAFSHPLKSISCATAHPEGFLLNGNFSLCKDYTLRRGRQAHVHKKVVNCQQMGGSGG